MDEKKILLQRREIYVADCLKVREGTDGKQSRTIEGRAIVFNSITTLFDGKYEKVREQIAPSCITADWLQTQDVKLNLLHKRDATVARCNMGVGTLQMEVKDDGLYFSCEMPKCDLGDRALALVANGTYTGCSFEFLVGKYTEEVSALPDGRNDTLITHTSFAELAALTIGMDPAYKDTSVDIREAMQQREADEDSRREMAETLRTSRERRRKAEIRRKQVETFGLMLSERKF